MVDGKRMLVAPRCGFGDLSGVFAANSAVVILLSAQLHVLIVRNAVASKQVVMLSLLRVVVGARSFTLCVSLLVIVFLA